MWTLSTQDRSATCKLNRPAPDEKNKSGNIPKPFLQYILSVALKLPHPDLERRDSLPARVESGNGGRYRGLKSEEMGTLDGVDILKNPPVEESKVKEVSVLEIGEVLKKRKEAMAALHLLLTGEEEEPAEVGNKVKRIVKKSVAVDRINSMRANPCSTFQELSPEVLNSQSQEFLVTYNRSRIFDQKVRAYEQALIQQYDSHGYAEDEIEVTDCSEDEIEVTVDEGMVDKITGV
ncbi:hypothetical protein HU200_043817 [Digitaria exilis]|uniref:Uncharacterized protein n=1 Tax=Digitaria exilis TaxID=1010633 RepID=A0A835B5B6_9POAL|nr:hypothetical protein HU200_043817 [Digitaria exilis]